MVVPEVLPIMIPCLTRMPLLLLAFLIWMHCGRSRVVIERARVALLPWGDGARICRLQQTHPKLFDFILGADVVYAAEFVQSLLATSSAMLAHANPQVGLRCCRCNSHSHTGAIQII